MRTIGISLPTWERPDITFDVFSKVYDDPRVETITISDDYSSMDTFVRLNTKAKPLSKVRLHRNIQNLDCAENKMRSTWLSPMEWNALIDSDNQIDEDYLDRLYEFEKWEPDTIYTPDFAMPLFDFREFSGLLITKKNVAEYMDRRHFETLLNACNYFVHRESYMNVWSSGVNIDPVTSDSIWFCYKWLSAGNKIQVVKGLQYNHRVWEESHYRKNVGRTPPGFHQEVLRRLKELK